MTVAAQTPVNNYQYSGSPTFVYTFQVRNAADLVVAVDGFDKTQGVDYSFTSIGAPGGGTITYLGALTTGQTVTIRRVTMRTRTTDYQNNGDLLAATLNGDIDRVVFMVQESDAENARALQLPIGESALLLPAAAARANRLLSFDAMGNPAASAPVAGTAIQLAIDLMSGTLANTGAGQIGFNPALSYSATTVGYALRNSDASWLASGFIPAARFPLVLPASSGANLVALSAPQLLGIVPNASFPATLPAGVTVPAGQLSGDVIQARIATALNASGAAPIYPCRAWVNFNGTGVVLINLGASGNVANITDNGVGEYTINFITNMPDTNFAVITTGSNDNGDTTYRNTTNQNRSTLTTSSCRIFGQAVNSATQVKEDLGNINVAVFR